MDMRNFYCGGSIAGRNLQQDTQLHCAGTGRNYRMAAFEHSLCAYPKTSMELAR
jgi:hypothetical protein